MQTPVGLASWLGGGSVFIVLLALAALALSCAILLGRQVRQQALIRAQLAVTSAREQLRRDGEDLLSNARDLAERPELTRLLAPPSAPAASVPVPVPVPAAAPSPATPAAAPAAGAAAPSAPVPARAAAAATTPAHTPAPAATPPRAAPHATSGFAPQVGGLTAYLGRFNEATSIDASALLRGSTLLASAGPRLNWSEVVTALQEQGDRFMLAPSGGGPLIWGAAASVAGTPVRVVTLRLSTPALLAALGSEVGAQLQVVNFATYHAPPDDPITPLHTLALSTHPGNAAAALLPHGDWYAASLAIATQTGEVVGLLDARLSGATFEAAIRSFDRVLITTALLVAAAAGVMGLLYGRWLARPVVALRDIAERIGRGDFSAAIPAVAPLEVGALARSMDEMRRRLVDLTDALRRREAEAQAVLAGVIEGVFAVDDQRRIRYANTQVARLLRRSPSEIVGQFCGDVLRPAPVQGERPCERNCPILAARSSSQASARELLCLSDVETRSTIVLSAPPIQGIQVQILRDETDLEAARRARDSVLGNISHEFRTPLAAQLASIELLRDGLGDMRPDAQQELLANVERGVLRLMRLIDNLLESVRIEAGQLSIRQQAVQLLEVVIEAQDLIAPLLQQRGLVVEIDERALGVIVTGDTQRLVQVFVNLLANAAKFAPEGSTIRIGGQAQDPELRRAMGPPPQMEVWVEDEGPGVPAGSASTIFERFQRGEGTEPEAPGLGLGLWIVKSIVERHGGAVRVERTAQGRTRFCVLLPQSQPVDLEPSRVLS
ncbi:MAG TPA: ATP-binding protein [Steroidobacteraceae bacterium]|nr:ATP-binding protein [Steroidobacteraceae bacterium]